MFVMTFPTTRNEEIQLNAQLTEKKIVELF